MKLDKSMLESFQNKLTDSTPLTPLLIDQSRHNYQQCKKIYVQLSLANLVTLRLIVLDIPPLKGGSADCTFRDSKDNKVDALDTQASSRSYWVS